MTHNDEKLLEIANQMLAEMYSKAKPSLDFLELWNKSLKGKKEIGRAHV
jgi:hypothetical protein